MTTFLKLTDYNTSRPIYLNVDNVIHFSDRDQTDCTDIVITTHVERLRVKETAQQIAELLKLGCANIHEVKKD